MPAAERTITIDRPVTSVFDYVADGSNAPRWRSGVLDVALSSGTGLGAIYTQGVRGPGGRRIAADYEVTAFEPGSLVAFRAIAGPVRPEGSFIFASAGEGTRLTFALNAELGGLKALLMGRAVQSTMDGEMAALDRLKAILEG